jgi:hypothetical protein
MPFVPSSNKLGPQRTWGIKQRLHLEDFLVRSWMSLRRLLWLVAW